LIIGSSAVGSPWALDAVKRGAGWYIAADAVEEWTHDGDDVSRTHRGSPSACGDVRAARRSRAAVGVASAVVVSVHRKGAKWLVRYQEGEPNRSRSFRIL
jgi:hypothetical protein